MEPKTHHMLQIPHQPKPIETSSDQATHDTPISTFQSNFIHKVRTNLTISSKWTELNGAMGDLGTYIPIVLALALAKDLNLGTTLIFTGVYKIVGGAIYGVPMPVQPMKSIVAAALANGPDFGVPEIMAAGICTGTIMLILGVTGLMQVVYKLVPRSVVNGIQLAQGLSFALSAVNYIQKVQDFPKAKSREARQWLGFDGLVLAILCACFVVVVDGAGGAHQQQHKSDQKTETSSGDQIIRLSYKRKMSNMMALLPTAFLIFLLGVILAFVRRPEVVKDIAFGPSSIRVVKLSRHAWKEGFIKGTIPQLPLTILNSVIAVCKLSSDLFPEKGFSATLLAVTVGLMNVVGCWFGAMPCCHGAGGLAGHYRFGGRSGGCVALLGAAKLVLGLALGTSLVTILNQFPVGFLGVMLFFAGIELAMVSKNMKSVEDSFVVLICTVVSLVGSDTVLGFVCGIVVHLLLRLRSYMSKDGVALVWDKTTSKQSVSIESSEGPVE